jgi:class 3 adenylate cyclase
MPNRTPRRLARRTEETLPEEVTVALLFCDVVRSTELTHRLGDCGAYRVIRSFHSTVLRAASAHHGEELELRGDGVLLAFAGAAEAAACALAIQRGLLELPRELRVNVRIGVHVGSVLRIATGYFGTNVILSARIAEEAAPGEILVSSALAQALHRESHDFGAGRWVELEGIPEPNLVFSLPWRPEAPEPEPSSLSPAVMALLLTLDRVRESRPTPEEASCMLAQRSAV